MSEAEASEREIHQLGNRMGQQRRKDDWIVGQYLRKTDPLKYRDLRTTAIEIELDELKKGFGASPESQGINNG